MVKLDEHHALEWSFRLCPRLEDFHDHFIQHDFEHTGHLSPALLEELRLARYHELLIRARYFREQPVEARKQPC